MQRSENHHHYEKLRESWILLQTGREHLSDCMFDIMVYTPGSLKGTVWSPSNMDPGTKIPRFRLYILGFRDSFFPFLHLISKSGYTQYGHVRHTALNMFKYSRICRHCLTESVLDRVLCTFSTLVRGYTYGHKYHNSGISVFFELEGGGFLDCSWFGIFGICSCHQSW